MTTVVRVLTGSRTGAEAPLPANGRASVGHEYWHDVVIREASTKGCAIEIEADGDALARLTVLDGKAVILGSELAVGDTAVFPPYVPCQIGDVAFAWGDPASARWEEAGKVAVASSPVATVTPDPTPASLADGWRESLRDTTGGRLGKIMRSRLAWGALALLLIALLAGPAIDALQLSGGPAQRASRVLTANGYRDVTAADSGSGEVTLAGYVPSDADRQRIVGLMAQNDLRAVMAVGTGEELARTTTDVARMRGVDARARALGAGTVELTTMPLDPDTRDKLDAAVHRDVPGLRRIVFRDDVSMGPRDDVKTVADLTKRPSSLVTGDPSYILTADGARYFPGSVMPSGHRLIAIEERTLVLERNGRRVLMTV